MSARVALAARPYSLHVTGSFEMARVSVVSFPTQPELWIPWRDSKARRVPDWRSGVGGYSVELAD